MDVNIILICIFILTILLIFTIYILIVYSGLLTEVTIGAGKPQVETTKVFYKAGVGTYQDVGPTCSDVASIAPMLKSFAIYYDDPTKMHEKERWAVGAFLDLESDDERRKVTELFERHGYKPFTFPKVQNVVKSSFPNTTPFSYSMGSYKVYPEIAHYVKERKLCAHPWIEIYDGLTIHYMVPLSRQEEFYVPEVIVPKTNNEKSQKPKRKSFKGKDRKSNKEDSELDLLEERKGVVNLENKEIVSSEHTYASQSSNDTQEKELSMNSAGDIVSKSEAVPKQLTNKQDENNHDKRSKSVNVLTAKSIPSTKPPRSSSAIPCDNKQKPPSQLMCSDSPNLKDIVKETELNDDEDGTCDSLIGDESCDDSSLDSMNTTAETVESSFFSSEYSYSSADTHTSQETSRRSCDLDTTTSSQ